MNRLFGRVTKVHVEGDYKADFSSDDLHIEFEVPFDDDEKPNQSIISIYNLSASSVNKIKKDATLILQAGYRSDYGVLTQGKISRVYTNKNGVDKVTTIYCLEGQDLSGKKTKDKISFKPGTKASVIIKRLANVLGIKLAEVTLPSDVIYKKGYTVTGNIENNLVEVVKDCGASMYNRRGSRVIRSIKLGTDERFRLDESTGLLGTPESFEEEGLKGYNVKCLLQHRITTASIIEIHSKSVKGKFRAKKGVHLSNGTDFKTEVQVI